MARDVALALGYTDLDKAVRTNCKYAKIFKSANSAVLTSSPRGLSIIPEADVYRPIMRSNLPDADEKGITNIHTLGGKQAKVPIRNF